MGKAENWEDVFTRKKSKLPPGSLCKELADRMVCKDAAQHLDTLPANSVDLIVTDPPYYQPVQHYIGRKGYKRTVADESILSGYFAYVFEKMFRVLRPSGACYVFCSASSYPVMYNSIKPLCKHLRLLIWDKMGSFLGYTWRHQHELIMFATGKDFRDVGTGDGDILRYKPVKMNERIHPIHKPIELMEKLIAKHGTDKLVLDPFAGSGSVGVAAHNTGNYFHLVEMDESHYDVMHEYVCKKTGLKLKSERVQYEEMIKK